MRGSRAERIAGWLSREHGIPLWPVLKLRAAGGPRQAELGIRDRLMHAPRFTVPSHLRPRLRRRKVLLIDDFATTGHTLRSAAATLTEGGARAVHGFCLGMRLPSASASATAAPTFSTPPETVRSASPKTGVTVFNSNHRASRQSKDGFTEYSSASAPVT